MFLKSRHSLLTLASAPLAPEGFLVSETKVSDRFVLSCRFGDGRADLQSRLSARVALVTVNTVVHITVYIRVAEVVRVVAAMAGRALEYRVIVRICMARGANAVSVAMVDRELRVLRVIERRTSPGGRVVACRAGGREELRLRGV